MSTSKLILIILAVVIVGLIGYFILTKPKPEIDYNKLKKPEPKKWDPTKPGEVLRDPLTGLPVVSNLVNGLNPDLGELGPLMQNYVPVINNNTSNVPPGIELPPKVDGGLNPIVLPTGNAQN